ncbi:MAG TPA: alpha/beta hydrolase [Gemmatimonadales bacterium]|nr:alpha/beta hydrolase [Gemmatimonadales bacterium]
MGIPEDEPHAAGITARDGIQLRCELAGSGRTTALLPLACWTLPDLLPLATGRRLAAYDPRGRGASDTVGPSQQFGLAADVADLEMVRAALDLPRVALIGWSYFAGVAAHYAAAYPHRVSRLVLLAPIPLRRIPWFGQAAHTLVERIDADAMTALQAGARAGAAATHPCSLCRDWQRALLPAYVARTEAIERMRADPCRWPNEHPSRLNPLLDRLWQSLGDWDWQAELAALDVPTLILQGDSDFQPREAAEAWAAHLNAHLEIVPGAGHLAWIDCPGAVLKAVSAFLDR